MKTYSWREGERDRENKRERETERERDRQTERQRQRDRERQTEAERDRVGGCGRWEHLEDIPDTWSGTFPTVNSGDIS